MRKCIVAFIAAIVATAAAYEKSAALTAKEIVERSEKAVRGDSQVALVEITIKRRRWTRTMEMKSWDNRVARKSFAEILAPKKDAGNRFLMISKEGLMWQYNPDIGKELKIDPSMMLQSWMGSDFSNDDIVKQSSIIDDYTHALSGKKTVEGHNSYVITLTPRPEAAVVWGEMIYFARVDDCLPVREEFYDQHGNLKKLLTLTGFRDLHGHMVPTVYKMITMKKQDGERAEEEFTMMKIKDAIYNIKIGDGIFTLQNLKKG